MEEGCIFIVGYMGAGKSSGGRRLATAMELPFFDTDAALSEAHGSPISTLFEEWGENRFRQEETAVLHHLASLPGPKVVATGGGTPCFGTNMDFMLAQGTVIHFQVALGSLLNRLQAKRKERPLIASVPEHALGAFIEAHLAEREPVYGRAHIAVDADALDAGRLASIARMIRSRRGLNP